MLLLALSPRGLGYSPLQNLIECILLEQPSGIQDGGADQKKRLFGLRRSLDAFFDVYAGED